MLLFVGILKIFVFVFVFYFIFFAFLYFNIGFIAN
jgi:hypothetical protein